MARGDLLKSRLEARIDASEHTLTLNFPPGRAAAQGTAPAAAPASPLTGIRPQPTLLQTPATPSVAPLTIQCLWIDAYDKRALIESKGPEASQVGWVAGANALATVKVSDVSPTPDAPTHETLLDDTEYIEHDGQQFRVLKVSPVGPGFRKPCAYAVWLAGATKQ